MVRAVVNGRRGPELTGLTVMTGRTAIVVKGYPRLSETFIAQEIRGLEERGLDIEIVSLKHPTDKHTHPVHAEITAPVRYMPEYLYHEPWRVCGRGVAFGSSLPTETFDAPGCATYSATGSQPDPAVRSGAGFGA